MISDICCNCTSGQLLRWRGGGQGGMEIGRKAGGKREKMVGGKEREKREGGREWAVEREMEMREM